MTSFIVASNLQRAIQALLAERAPRVSAIGPIDKTLADVAAALETVASITAIKPLASIRLAMRPAPVSAKRAKRGAHSISATDFLLAFAKARGNATSKEIGAHLASQARSSGATAMHSPF